MSCAKLMLHFLIHKSITMHDIFSKMNNGVYLNTFWIDWIDLVRSIPRLPPLLHVRGRRGLEFGGDKNWDWDDTITITITYNTSNIYQGNTTFHMNRKSETFNMNNIQHLMGACVAQSATYSKNAFFPRLSNLPTANSTNNWERNKSSHSPITDILPITDCFVDHRGGFFLPMKRHFIISCCIFFCSSRIAQVIITSHNVSMMTWNLSAPHRRYHFLWQRLNDLPALFAHISRST